jgi:NRAMP (natural resistance-associated macrophage protein)-like metal ion transporter
VPAASTIRPRVNRFLWLGAELAIVACDLAEVLGSALALHLLFGVSIPMGIAITAFDTLLVLGLQGAGFRRVEAIVLGLVGTIAGCFIVELAMAPPNWFGVAMGFAPSFERLQQPGALYLAIGVVGATVMPHNLYLHSSIVQTRLIADTDAARREAVRFCTLDAVVSLSLALLVNAAIMVLAASAFHATGHQSVTEIDDAYRLIEPIVGSAFAATLFGIALLASGQSSTFTGTIAGQIIMEGFLDLKIPCWQRRLITRAAGAGAGVPGRLVVRRWRRGQDAGAEPGGAEFSAAFCDVAADPLHEQPRPDGRLCQRRGGEAAGLGPLWRDRRGQRVADRLGDRRQRMRVSSSGRVSGACRRLSRDARALRALRSRALRS